MKVFICSQFRYCPLALMFHSRQINNNINNLHERALRVVCRDHHAHFLNKSVTILQTNLQLLPTEIFITKNELSPGIMEKIFRFKNGNYNLKNTSLKVGKTVIIIIIINLF